MTPDPLPHAAFRDATSAPDSERRWVHDAFISYRRKDASRAARSLRHRLLEYRLPATFGADASRSVSIYLDTIYERANADFFEETIKPALAASRYLFVVVSAHALRALPDGQPNWLEREIEYFLTLPQGGNIVIAVADGRLDGPLPADLGRRFPNIEILDVREFNQRRWLRPATRRSELELLKLVATLHDVPHERMPELYEEEALRKAARDRRRFVLAVAASVVFGVLAATAWYQADVAEAQARSATSRGLASQALAVLNDRTDVAVLLGAAATRIEDGYPARSALGKTLAAVPFLETYLSGHTGPVLCVAFGDGGRYLASIGQEGDLLLWDLQSRKRLALVPGVGAVQVAFDPKRERLATLGPRGIQFWAVPTLIPQGTPVPAGRTFAWSPDGSTLATLDEMGAIVFIGSDDMQRKGTPLMSHRAPPDKLAFSRDGRILLSGSADGMVRMWDVARSEAIGNPLAPHNKYVESLAVSGDGVVASGDTGGTIRLWDLATGQLKQTVREHRYDVRAMSFSGDNNVLASGGVDGTVRIWDAASGRQLTSVGTGPSGWVHAVAFGPDGLLASGSQDGSIRLWRFALRVRTLDDLWTQGDPWMLGAQPKPLMTQVFNAVLKADSARLTGPASAAGAASAARTEPGWSELLTPVLGPPDADGGFLVWGMSRAPLLHKALGVSSFREPKPDSETNVVRYSADGRWLASGGSAQHLDVWETAGDYGRHFMLEPVNGKTVGIAFCANPPRLYSADEQGTLSEWDLRDRKLLNSRQLDLGKVSVLALSKDCTRIALGTDKGDVALVTNGAEAEPLLQPVRHEDRVRTVEFSSDTKSLLSSSSNKTVRWDFVSSPSSAAISSIGGGDVTPSPDGSMVAVWGLVNDVRLWDARTAERPIGAMKGHEDGVISLAFSPDGKTIATGSFDNTIRLWDVKTLQQIGEPLRGELRAHALAFSPDGTQLASAGDRVLVWSVSSATWRSLACKRANRDLSDREWQQFVDPGMGRYLACE